MIQNEQLQQIWLNRAYRGPHYLAYVCMQEVDGIDFSGEWTVRYPVENTIEKRKEHWWISVEAILDVIGIFDAGDHDWIIERPLWGVTGLSKEDAGFSMGLKCV